MIELHKHGKTVLFDDTGVDREAPGLIRSCLYEGYFYEERFLEHIRELGRRGAYVDAGAFIGTHTLFFAIMCESTHVFAFEPRPVQHAELARNIKANGLESKVTACQFGLADERKKVTTELDGESVDIECVSLDEIVDGKDIAVVKIDVEGMEVDVLRGARHVLEHSKPAIFAEAHTEAELNDIRDYLRPFGYAWSGRDFNTSPTYEFFHVEDANVRLALEDVVRQRDRRRVVAKRLKKSEDRLEGLVARLEAERDALEGFVLRLQGHNAALRTSLEQNLRRLESARRSLTFRVGRATKLALRDASSTPWQIPARWVDVFRGRDEVLEEAEHEAREAR